MSEGIKTNPQHKVIQSVDDYFADVKEELDTKTRQEFVEEQARTDYILAFVRGHINILQNYSGVKYIGVDDVRDFYDLIETLFHQFRETAEPGLVDDNPDFTASLEVRLGLLENSLGRVRITEKGELIIKEYEALWHGAMGKMNYVPSIEELAEQVEETRQYADDLYRPSIH